MHSKNSDRDGLFGDGLFVFMPTGYTIYNNGKKKTKARVEMFTYSKFSNASSIIVAIL